MKSGCFWRATIFVSFAWAVHAAPRVALMDFSTDDNSYRSAQSAADFSGLLQVQMADEPGVEWIERAQLDKARQELELSTMDGMHGGAALRQGKWLKADWLVTGQFSLDDRNRRTLFLEITDLQHADVLANRTITFPGTAAVQFQADTNQVVIAAAAVHQLFTDAHLCQQQRGGKILVAPLFFADVTGFAPGFGSSGNVGALEPVFLNALERAVATNGRVQIIRFPKAYRSLEESEMVLDGLVEADRNAWQQTADLYVWGTYAVIYKMTPGKPPVDKLAVDLHVWDGVTKPTVISEEVPCSFFGDVQPDQLETVLNRLANQMITHAHKSTVQVDTVLMRKEIAQSLVATYDQMTNPTGHNREELGLNDPVKFLQAVHMLETASFFDPDNADARVLYITCRWGWWMDFTFEVKNEFWSKWRRSEAWGKYVNRFGLKPVAVELPFPYQQEGGIPEVYLRSLEDVLKMFPEWHSAEEMTLEDGWQRQGVYTSLMEAENHGFPKTMPHDLAWNWKIELTREYWKRLTKVTGFISEAPASQEGIPPMLLSTAVHGILYSDESPVSRLALLEKIWPQCVQISREPGKRWVIAQPDELDITNLCRKAGVPEKAGQLMAMLSINQPATMTEPATRLPVISVAPQISSTMVAIPKWITEIQPTFSLFRLFPPNALPLEIHPDMRTFQFPKQFEVQAVEQMNFLADKVLILAMDERSAPSSEPNPSVSAERLEKRGRLWILAPDADNPVLFKPDLFPETVRSFFLENHNLWVAGTVTGCLDLKTQKFQKFDSSEGFSLQEPGALETAGGRIFAAGDFFKVCEFNPLNGRWNELPKPSGNLFMNGGSPRFLIGNQRWLVYSAGSVLAYDVKIGTWTNLSNMAPIQCAVAENSGFWIGNDNGLQFYDPSKNLLENWHTADGFQGLMNPLMGVSYTGGSEIRQGELDRLDGQIQDSINHLEKDRTEIHTLKLEKKSAIDPLNLNWRIPGGVTAMANDGDFLWLGVGNYFGNYLLLLHKPSHSLVAYCRVDARGKISSLLVSATSVLVGMAYGDQLLFQFPKAAFLSIPQGRWVSLAISAEERGRLIRGMSIHDQAMYAFYAGDDARVVQLLADVNSDKANLEEMFLLAFSYDSLGLDKPDLCRSWFERIISSHRNSPWAKAAQTALSKNELDHKVKAHKELLLAKYDLNHNGILDPAEKLAMQKDPGYQREETVRKREQFEIQLEKIMQQFDQNGDGKLDREELKRLRAQVVLFLQAPPEMLATHNIPVAPLLSKDFPSVSIILQKYDANHDGGLETNELKTFAQDVHKNR